MKDLVKDLNRDFNMTIKVIKSGSSGNCTVISEGGRHIIIDAGVRPELVREVVGYNNALIEAVLVSHDHKDHSEHIGYWIKTGVPVYFDRSGSVVSSPYSGIACKKHKHFSWIKPCGLMGEFIYNTFPVYHDMPNSAFLVTGVTSGKTAMYCTDTARIDVDVPGIDLILIEANYCPKILERNITSGALNHNLGGRIKEMHMSIETSIEYINRVKTPRLKSVVLMHLSSMNSNEKEFIEKTQRATGIPTYVGDNLTIEI
jgi:ribonuclease BN (tRNA processing enzyme)